MVRDGQGSGNADWHCRLSVPACLVLCDGTTVYLSALVDAGSEANLIRRGLVHPSHTTPCGPEVKFCAVNQQSLGGNHRRVTGSMVMWGVEQDTGAKKEVSCPIRVFEASIDVDAILSYEWLARQNMVVVPRQHGIAVSRDGESIWVAGIKVGVSAKAADLQVCKVRGGERIARGEDYVMRKEYYDECILRLGLTPTFDCFASGEVSKCAKFYSLEEDSLTQEWGVGEILWVNPPWSLWPQVADKLLASECTAICVLPAWCVEWVRRVVHTAVRRVYIERGTRLYERFDRKCPGTRWGTWVVRVDGKARPPLEGGRAYQTIFLPKWRLPVQD